MVGAFSHNDKIQFALTVAAISVYVALSSRQPSQPVYFGQEGLPAGASDDTYVLVLFAYLIAIGIAFAPPKWADLIPNTVIATVVLVSTSAVFSMLAGTSPGLLNMQFSLIIQLLTGLYVFLFICFSLGLGIFRVIARYW